MRLSGFVALASVAAAGALLWWLPTRTPPPSLPQVSLRQSLGASDTSFALEAGSRRVENADAPATSTVAPDAPAPLSTLGLDECTSHVEAEARRACLAQSFERTPSLDELASWLCTTSRPLVLQMEVLATFVRRAEPAQAWTWLDGLQTRCGRQQETHLFQGALQLAGQADAAWLRGFERSLAPEVLFSRELGEAPVQVAVMLAQNGSEYARFVLERGGCGDFGGNARQIDRAASCSLALQQPGQQFYAYLCQVAESPNLPEDSGLGSTLAVFLSDPRARPGGNALAPLLRLSEVLADRRLNQSAALTLLQQVGADAPPGVDADVWRGLIEQARSVLPAGLR
ncbi:MAG: hypothetical protein EPO68_02680 [Planctomycetota bacterium]|nr:MAG: hypothetical protein EPO68_02680 [Planctomycetota bacterium]